MKTLIFILFISVIAQAKVLISIEDAIYSQYGHDIAIEKKSIILKKDEAKKLQYLAKAKIKSKIFNIYMVKKHSKIVGYSVLISKNIRSKNGVVLYMLDAQGVLKGIEVIAFNEPLEYLPSDEWKKQFKGLDLKALPKVGDNIHTITGATLSAKSITRSARIAQALYDIKLKGIN